MYSNYWSSRKLAKYALAENIALTCTVSKKQKEQKRKTNIKKEALYHWDGEVWQKTDGAVICIRDTCTRSLWVAN